MSQTLTKMYRNNSSSHKTNIFAYYFFFPSYRDDCEQCMQFQAKWEYIASQLFGRINLATVNIMSDGISTGSRFGVQNVPTFLL